MIAFRGMLAEPARQAGILVPPDPENFDDEQYTRFAIFCIAQLGQPMPNAAAHWDNAYVVAKIPEEQLKTITFERLLGMGFQVGRSD